MSAERAEVIAELHAAYLAKKLGAVCDEILARAALVGPREPLVNPLMLDAFELRAIVEQVRPNPDAWVAWHCRGCGDPVERSGGLPHSYCEACRTVQRGAA